MRATIPHLAGPLCLALPISLLPAAAPCAAGAERAALVRALPIGWITYLGGKSVYWGDDEGAAIAADRQGNVYVTGDTAPTDFPTTPGAAQYHSGDGFTDAYVAAYDAQGRLRWATYLGGSELDYGTAIATDRQGDIYATGWTDSDDFPITPGAAQPHYAGFGINAFVVSYDGHGRLRWATYLGGKGDNYGYGIATDGQGNVYVTGSTSSTDFPATRDAAQPRYGGGQTNAFVASYDRHGHLRWATYLGGKGGDAGKGVAADGQGNVYVTGSTSSSDFPLTRGAAQPRYGVGDTDAFVTTYDANGRLRWSTYLGGSDADSGSDVAVDGQGNVYVAGTTTSADFPVTRGAAQSRRGGSADTDAFVASYDGQGRRRWTTYLGGQDYDAGAGIATDDAGTVYVTGATASPDFPITPDAAQPRYGGGTTDAFVAAYDGQGHLHWATYLGGSRQDAATGIAAGGQGTADVAGTTMSADFPITPGAAQPTFRGDDYGNAFVARLVVPAGRLPRATGTRSPAPAWVIGRRIRAAPCSGYPSPSQIAKG